VCGELKKIDKPCPWCEEARADADREKHDDDDLGINGL